ncbi:MAG: NUDIX domain-containing protein [Chloroflexi bacterium]|nr:NUDIX domain-containing protein [Chloroflexota bacterium]
MSESPHIRKHFTATAFVVRGEATLLHWHKRLAQWLPPGGHIEPDEEPAEAALREVREETGLVCEVVATSPSHAFAQPRQLPAPYTILLEDIPDAKEPAHMHIDLIYFVQPVDGADHGTVDDPSLTWVTEAELRDNCTLDPGLPDTTATAVREDVRTLALAAITAVRSRSA